MRVKLQAVVIGLALLAGVHPTIAQVTNLGIATVAGGQSLVYWPANSTTNYVLQTTASLTLPNWVTATNAVTVNAVTVTNSAPVGFFRLQGSTNPPGMALIPAGSFLMGNNLVANFYNTNTNDLDITDASPTNVYTSAFYMDVNLVSSNQWAVVYNAAINSGYTFGNTGAARGGNYPVMSVNWYDCVAWCNARSQQAGLTPCYYADAGLTQIYKNSDGTSVYLNMANNGYRLPTEAEWEKAARGGLKGNRFPGGNIITESQANYTAQPASYNYDLGPYNGANTNYDSNPINGSSPVGSFAPNAYGLYDMSGNSLEWCWDWYAAGPYAGGSNPTGPATGTGRVIRGGCWLDTANDGRCAERGLENPGATGFSFFSVFGFRCVKGL